MVHRRIAETMSNMVTLFFFLLFSKLYFFLCMGIEYDIAIIIVIAVVILFLLFNPLTALGDCVTSLNYYS